MGSIGTNNAKVEQSNVSTFKFRELPEGNSSADKRARASRIVQDLYAVGERGTQRDLQELIDRVTDFNNNKKLFKSDSSRIDNAIATAERGIKRRKAWG